MNKTYDNKCGSCDYYKPIDGTARGYCLGVTFGEEVGCDKDNPHPMRNRSQTRCKEYKNSHNDKNEVATNYDRIVSMNIQKLSEFMNHGACPPGKDLSELCYEEDGGSNPDLCGLCWLEWLKQPCDMDK